MGRPKKEKPNKQGLYEVKISVGHSFDGKPVRKSFYSSVSKADAKAKAEQYKINQAVSDATGEMFIAKDECFDVWAIKWLETYKKDKVKEHTYEFTYKKNVEKYLIPFFKHAKLKNIKQIDIQNYFNKVENPDNGASLSYSVLDKHKMILKSIFDAAIDNDLCYKNPIKNISFPNVSTKKERTVYSAEEAKILEEYAMINQNYDIIILLNTGLRRSELLGLKWSDIDFDSKFIHIQRAVTQTTGKVMVDKPKTETSDRYIPIDEKIKNLLLNIPHESEYVIVGENNDPMSPHSYADKFNRFMIKMNKDIGLKILTPHELRHTYGTLLRESGVDIYTIQKVMGHSDISVTVLLQIPRNKHTKSTILYKEKRLYLNKMVQSFL